MDENEIDEAIALVPPLLRALETLGFASRHLHPPALAELAPVLTPAEVGLRTAHTHPNADLMQVDPFRAVLYAAADETLAAFDGFKAALDGGDVGHIYRAFRHVPRAQEMLYRLAEIPPVSRYFLDPEARGDDALIARLANAPPSENTGVQHFSNNPGTRGGFSLYVPETYTPDTQMPLVIALHGGSGHGRGFLWTWLRDARAHGAILISPTAIGNTWALQGADVDTPNLLRMVDHVCANYNVDRSHILLTGMSDGGTFSYVTGLEGARPFTHLAPISAAFHPMLAQFADEDRIRGLPIHIIHGALDWMFPIAMAKQAEHFLSKAGANVTFVGLDDLSHTYPREQNPEILRWMLAT
jgi:phospholipase/carboxylesterase